MREISGRAVERKMSGRKTARRTFLRSTASSIMPLDGEAVVIPSAIPTVVPIVIAIIVPNVNFFFNAMVDDRADGLPLIHHVPRGSSSKS